MIVAGLVSRAAARGWRLNRAESCKKKAAGM
jgi:hypothetical protein